MVSTVGIRGVVLASVSDREGERVVNVLIFGVNGFIGHHLSQRIIDRTDWHVYGMDMHANHITPLLNHPRFHFFEGDIAINREWMQYHVKKCDVILPLVAIATPASYVRHPLAVFELDFECNLPIIRDCVRYRKRLVFPSTSEVYGMCRDAAFHPDESNFILGPINKPRWIYSCAKQLMDRVIWAYGMEAGLDFTLIRPFNWIGSGLDSLHTPKEGSSRVVTQFLGHIARGEAIQLVDGGSQRRCFTDIDDGIDALMRVIENPNGVASGKIYNIGNPNNGFSIRELAQLMLEIAAEFPEYQPGLRCVKLMDVNSARYYGEGYQDIEHRVPWIDNTCQDLQWQPKIALATSLRRIFATYRTEVERAGALLDQDELTATREG
ncbi:MAG: bifunctional UDP-4-keto-pentose/UDP-xylose synthase [Magnetococcales bacterium]|nr:bifunctional UDP-4-keto-pentose/UDP-xylose synthase [Magnetococcales bacterium]